MAVEARGRPLVAQGEGLEVQLMAGLLELVFVASPARVTGHAHLEIGGLVPQTHPAYLVRSVTRDADGRGLVLIEQLGVARRLIGGEGVGMTGLARLDGHFLVVFRGILLVRRDRVHEPLVATGAGQFGVHRFRELLRIDVERGRLTCGGRRVREVGIAVTDQTAFGVGRPGRSAQGEQRHEGAEHQRDDGTGAPRSDPRSPSATASFLARHVAPLARGLDPSSHHVFRFASTHRLAPHKIEPLVYEKKSGHSINSRVYADTRNANTVTIAVTQPNNRRFAAEGAGRTTWSRVPAFNRF